MKTGESSGPSGQSRLEAAMLAGEVAWWEMDVATGAVTFHDSKAEMLGYDPADFEHYEDFTHLVHPEDHDRAMESMRAHLEGRAEKYDVEYRIETADGSYGWFHDVGGVNEYSEEGDPLSVAGIVIDITDRKAAAAKAEVRNEQLALLNRIVRHDIANDMTVALGTLDLVEEDAEVSRETQELLDRVRSATEHVIDLTDAVGTVLEAIEDEQSATGQAIRIDQTLETQVESVHSMFEDAVIEVREDLPAVSVAGSPLLGSVLSNLMENAIEHNDAETPRIDVSVDVDPETVTVRFADNGPGIEDAAKERVFELGESRSQTGSGMGLFIARTLVEAFGGRIAIEDNEPRGAVFLVTLQRAD